MNEYPKRLQRGLHLLNKDPSVPKVVVVGCGKSGTYYMMKVLRILGFKVGHESMNKNGICSWYEVANNRAEDIKRWFDGHEVLYIHLLRNPIDVMNSTWRPVVLKDKHGLEFFDIYCPEYKHLKGWDYIAKYWVVWNNKAEENFPIDVTLAVEAIAEVPEILCKLLGVEYTREREEKIIALGTKTHSKEEEELVSLQKQGHGKPIGKEEILGSIKSPEIKEELMSEALRYGYDLYS